MYDPHQVINMIFSFQSANSLKLIFSFGPEI